MESRFREVQRFRQPWLWGLLLLSAAAVLGVNGYGAFRQLVQGQPWGNRPMSDSAFLLSTLLPSLLIGGLLWLFWRLELVVEVRREGVLVHFRPLKRRWVPYAEIQRIEACRYHPIAQYGGWGIRRGRGGWAYNVSGNLGVRLHLPGDRHLLIGSRRPQELASAIALEHGELDA